MKNLIVSAFLILVCSASKAYADQTANDTVTSTVTITVVSVSSSAATALTTNSKAMKYRNTFAVQNIGAYNIWCGDSSVTVSNGWYIAPYSVLSVPMIYYSGITSAVLRFYCISETAAVKVAVLEAY